MHRIHVEPHHALDQMSPYRWSGQCPASATAVEAGSPPVVSRERAVDHERHGHERTHHEEHLAVTEVILEQAREQKPDDGEDGAKDVRARSFPAWRGDRAAIRPARVRNST